MSGATPCSARHSGLRVIASAFDSDVDFVHALGASAVVDTRSSRLAKFAIAQTP
jgi:hypothetical protein